MSLVFLVPRGHPGAPAFPAPDLREVPIARAGETMFAVYSNRLGCLGSALVSLAGTVVLAGLVWVLSR
jgi:hypothetical protein